MKTKNKLTYQQLIAEMSQTKVTCLKCGSKKARLSPIGLLCPNCTFNKTEEVLKTMLNTKLPKIKKIYLRQPHLQEKIHQKRLIGRCCPKQG